MSQIQYFVDYVLSFYGAKGIYAMNVSEIDVVKALAIYLSNPETDCAFDSVDREKVRDILIDEFGYN